MIFSFDLHKSNVHILREMMKKLVNFGVNNLRVAPISEDGEVVDIKNELLSAEEVYKVIIDYISQYIADGALLSLNLGSFKCINADEYIISMVKAPKNINIDKICVCHSICK